MFVTWTACTGDNIYLVFLCVFFISLHVISMNCVYVLLRNKEQAIYTPMIKSGPFCNLIFLLLISLTKFDLLLFCFQTIILLKDRHTPSWASFHNFLQNFYWVKRVNNEYITIQFYYLSIINLKMLHLKTINFKPEICIFLMAPNFAFVEVWKCCSPTLMQFNFYIFQLSLY